MENRNGLVLDALVSQATGTAERDAALVMLDRRRGPRKRVTLGADKGYDTRAFIEALREREVTPHVAQHTNRRRSAIDGRTTQHEGYRISQRVRKRVEEVFGWIRPLEEAANCATSESNETSSGPPSRQPPTTLSGWPTST